MTTKTNTSLATEPILVLGATGKTGRRIVERLTEKGLPVRAGSRSAALPFDWNDPATWAPVLEGVKAVYIAYHPDLAVPGATDTIRALVKQAAESGVRRAVLLSGRGEEEAQLCEQIVQNSGLEWTIVRASWFAQNFSENFMRDQVMEGVVALPAGDVKEPFVDADDIADVAVAALTEEGHAGQLYEVTGPRLLSFTEAVEEIAQASGREVRFQPITLEQSNAAMEALGLPREFTWLLDYLFRTVLDGRNEYLTDGVQRALGRPPKDFAEFARDAASAGAWSEAPATAAA